MMGTTPGMTYSIKVSWKKVSFQDRQARIVPQRPFLEGTQNLTVLFWFDSEKSDIR